jgi:hypothetical protein
MVDGNFNYQTATCPDIDPQNREEPRDQLIGVPLEKIRQLHREMKATYQLGRALSKPPACVQPKERRVSSFAELV